MAAWKSSGKKPRKESAKAEPAAVSLADLVRPPSEAEVSLLVAARQNALAAFGFELQRPQMVEAASRSRALADKARLSVTQPAREAPVCQKGCSWCCHLKVGVTVPEVIAIVEHLQSLPAQLEVVRHKAAELAKDPRILSDEEKPKARLPCALLSDDGGCGVYEVRPVPCRGWLSTDVESCKKHLDGEAEPKFVVSAARSSRFVQLGLAKAMDDIQRRPYLVELTSGLDIALNVPDAIERWLEGEPIFDRASASRTPNVADVPL